VRPHGLRLLLDLHNLYVNARNLRFDAGAYIDGLDLDSVRELHIAGGNELYGVYLDFHAGPCPPEVWRLLDVCAALPASARRDLRVSRVLLPGLGDAASSSNRARARAALAPREQHVAV
jgi:uncharacterized protein (UPF0276 family)